MPPRKARASKKKAAEVVEEPIEQQVEVVVEEQIVEPTETQSKGKGKADDVVVQVVVEQTTADEQEVEKEVVKNVPEETKDGKLTQEQRLAKLKELRRRMNQSTLDNRKTLIEDHQKMRTTARELARLEKQKRLAENLREKINAEETGDDVQRKKNWNYSIEQNDKWEERLKKIEEKEKWEFNDEGARSERMYARSTEKLKINMNAYNKQKEAALGLAPGTLVPVEAKPQQNALVAASSSAVARVGDAYGDANSLSYAKDRPNDDAIDNVVRDMNEAYDRRNSRSKKRRAKDEAEGGDITYINDRNKVFNKKINRFFDKYTSEIRENFERGTAL